MDEYQPAIGRNVGKVDTDSGGLARYSLKLQLPPAINHTVEPELSLEYCQGGPNGSLGTGWALGGISCIRRAASGLAYDGINPGPANYDRTQSKLSLDGAELLNIEGEYGTGNAKYMTELDEKGRVITPSGLGFLIVDSTGFRAEYGTSGDSRVAGVDGQAIREWRLKQSSDYFGNTVVYTYVANPRGDEPTLDVNACYISSIRYTSNTKTGLEAKRLVKFEYSARPDVLVQYAQGVRCTWASLLTAIRCGTTQGESFVPSRSYEIGYTVSDSSGDSYIKTIMETAPNGATKVQLLPSRFGYSIPEVSKQDTFRASLQTIPLTSTINCIAMFSMNISGRCLADLACIRYDSGSRQMSVKTYLADNKDDGTTVWTESQGQAGEARLPPMNVQSGFPNILCPDLTMDGRADFVVPYQDSDLKLAFSVSESVGTGFKSANMISTRFRWIDGTKFMALDNPGRGPSIVQILNDNGKLTFRNWTSVIQDNKATLKEAVITTTKYDSAGSIDWIQLSHAGTGAKSLARIWERTETGIRQIKATTFEIGQDGKLTDTTTSTLGNPILTKDSKQSVLSCDINADGVQDIVIATANFYSDQVVLTFAIYLGNGFGGFRKYGEDVVRKIACEEPKTASNFGEFFVTNLNGSNYPSLSYVYQTKYANSQICLSVDGRSDATLGPIVSYRLADKLAFDKIQVIATDLNGNGIGDWLFYTLDRGTPRVLPTYNRSKCVDLLSWASDSMGLRTSLQYGCLSDEKVYKSGVSWKAYHNDSKDSYPLIAAPNYVVTGLEHRNDSSVNSLEYLLKIKKTYTNARINYLGRGWQGFSSIDTLNETNGVLTIETYRQDWPFTGVKNQIDTKSLDGKILKSVIVQYQKTSKSRGSWSTYRTDKIQEDTVMMDGDKMARINTIAYAYDEDGNMILRSPSEIQNGQEMYRFWDRCTYTAIDGVRNVLIARKTSSKGTNLDMTRFETGDTLLRLFENETSRAALKSVSTWSTDVQMFVKRTCTIDAYGREVDSIDSAGLRRSTTYDGTFQTFPTKITERGDGILTTQLTAYDVNTGLELARLATDGLFTCYQIDTFGRTLATRIRAPVQGESTILGDQFLAKNPYVADAELTNLLGRTHFSPQRKISFERILSANGSAYIATRVVAYCKEGVDGEDEVCEYLNCMKDVCKRGSRNGNSNDQIWTYWEYNSSGISVFESFPVKIPKATGLDWVPDKNLGVRSVVDIFGRPLSQVRPAHGSSKDFIISTSAYLDGGARIQERTLIADKVDPLFSAATQVAQIERRYIQMEKEDFVIENRDENGLASRFEYDTCGRLVKCVDAAGQIELRSYNSQGALVTLDSPYQNVTRVAGSLATKNVYNAAGHLVSEYNATGDCIMYQRDAKGRTLLKVGQDGRTAKFVYDRHGFEGLSSITIFPKGTGGPYESLLELAYDYCGRIKECKLTLADGKSFTIAMTYDWQGQILQKTLPTGVSLTHKYRGSELNSTTLSGGSSSPWTFTTETKNYSSFGRPETLDIRGSGIKDQFTHTWQYDTQGFPLVHRLDNSGKSLVDERYVYNNLDQLGLKSDFLSGTSTTYKCQGKRLSSSQTESGPLNTYDYDASGNLIKNRGINLAYSPGQVQGTKDNLSMVSATYDQAGRLKRRVTSQADLSVSYDSFGAVNSLSDSKNGEKVDIIADFNGEMLQRKQSDGSSDLFLSNDVSIHLQSDGSQQVRYNLFNGNKSDGTSHQIATVSTLYESIESTRPLSSIRRLNLQFTDNKGNITHTFDGETSALQEKLNYDDFGFLDIHEAKRLDDDMVHSTYEGKFLDNLSGLLNFGGRWYDPLIGRFTEPDDILDIASLLLPDGINRYVFENNDPVNKVDPTGHWSWSAILGVAISVVLIAAAIAITVATGGAAAPLAAAAVGALASGGFAGLMYSIEHRDEENAGRFW